MMDLTLRREYWDDLPARRAFKEFIFDIHQLDFTPWEDAGFWDVRYTPFSYFEGNRVISSVCIYSLDAVVDGKKTKIAQISGVGTLPEFRRRGLNRELTRIGLEWVGTTDHCGVFLFADEDAIPFYTRCGFTPIQEFIQERKVEPTPRLDGLVKIDPGNPVELREVYEAARRRTALSEKFSVLNPKLLAFHALYPLRDHVYKIPDLECFVFFGRVEDRVKLFDVVGESIPTFEELYPYLTAPNDRNVEFHFFPDKLSPGETRSVPLLGNSPFVLDPFPIEAPIFPFTAHA